MITATDTLTDRLCDNPSARIGLTTTSNIFANTISAAYNFFNQFHVTSSLTLNSAPSYDGPSVTEARADAFVQILASYNQALRKMRDMIVNLATVMVLMKAMIVEKNATSL